MAKIMIVGNNVMTLINFRKDLIRHWVKAGHKVIAVAPEPSKQDRFKGFAYETSYAETLKSLGAEFKPWVLSRCGCNPLKELTSILKIVKLIRMYKPDIIFSYNLKPNIYASLATNLIFPKPRTYSLITGLGYAFRGICFKQKIVSLILSFLLHIALLSNTKVFFQNKDDRQLFLKKRIISEHKTLVVNGTGVNLEDFPFHGPFLKQPTFTMISRMVWQKGVKEFIEAARMIKKKYPSVKFLLVGPLSNNPDAIPEETLFDLVKDDSVEYLGPSNDVKEILTRTSVFVLPSYYGEGVPKTILEAMAIGLPIITTNNVGCKETVENGINGFLVQGKDFASLSQCIEQMIHNPQKLHEMGLQSREIAQSKFDVERINELMTSKMLLQAQSNI